jgi:hypothetical protein
LPQADVVAAKEILIASKNVLTNPILTKEKRQEEIETHRGCTL